MNQQSRNRVATVMAIVLFPTMVYLMVTNIHEARRRGRSSAQDQAAPPPAPPPIEAARAVLSPATAPDLNSTLLAEQKRMAALVPARSPFSATSVSSDPEPSTPRTTAPDIPAVTEAPLELNGIIYSKTADRRSAIINGKMLGEGKSIRGYTIVTIGAGEVVLRNGTNRITLRSKQ
jgi:hypothetical protein